MELEDLLSPSAYKAYSRGIITLEEAYRISAGLWLGKGDGVKFDACCKAADYESEKGVKDGNNS